MYLKPIIKIWALAILFHSLSPWPIVYGAKKDKEPEWDINDPPVDRESIDIKTNQTTWSNVDVSPDGKWMIFDMLGDIYKVPLEGGQAQPLTNSIAWDFQARFSPDGRSIAFISDRDGADNIWIMDPKGENPQQVSKETMNLVHSPAWSPDGRFIAVKKGFTSSRSIPGGSIWAYHVNGGKGTQIRDLLHGKGSQKNITEPAYSRDGRYLYYSLDATKGKTWQYNKDSTGEIFVIRRLNLNTGKEEDIVGGPGGAVAPRISPNGKLLAFVKRVEMDSALYIKDLVSGVESRIYLGLDRDLQESSGDHGNTPQYAFTPDNKALVFWAKGHFHKVDIQTKVAKQIPVRIEVEKEIVKALRFKVDVAPERFQAKMIRWPQKSPDGRLIVFQALGYLYQQDTKTKVVKRLTTQTDHFEFYPAFSRDGQKIVYTTWNDQALGDVRTLDLKTGQSLTITQHPGHYISPQFSPSGQLVVYEKFTGGYLLDKRWSIHPGIYVNRLRDSNEWRLDTKGRHPHFGASEERIYLSRFDYQENQHTLVSVDLDGNQEREHLKGIDVSPYRISPNGEWVAFTEQFRAYVAPFVKTGKVMTLQSKNSPLPVRQVSKTAGEFLHFSHDSRSLFWSHGPTLYHQSLRKAFPNALSSIEPAKPITEGEDLSLYAATYKPKGLIALVGGRIVTMRNANKTQEIIEDGTIIIDGSKISAVGPRKNIVIPKGAKIISVEGKTIFPGLVDAHAHGSQGRREITPQQNWKNFSSLAYGVTTIHDPSNDTSEIFASAELQKAGLIVGPRIFSTGSILYGAHVSGITSKIESYEDAKFHVERLKKSGAISVKSYQQPRRSQRQMLIAAGKELEIMVVPEGGAKFHFNMGMIVDGHTGIEHAIPQYTGYDDVIQLWSQSETEYTPTFVVAYGGIGGENYWYDKTEVWKDQKLLKFVPRHVVEPLAKRRTTAPEHHYNHLGVARFAKTLRDKGVRVHIGAHGQREGLAAHWELWMMHQGGFSPWEALRAGTIDGAHYLGMDHALGSLEPGKLADLVVVQGNPLEDLRLSQKVQLTMIHGRLFDADSMNEIGHQPRKRQPFYFESGDISGMHPATGREIHEKKLRHHWIH